MCQFVFLAINCSNPKIYNPTFIKIDIGKIPNSP